MRKLLLVGTALCGFGSQAFGQLPVSDVGTHILEQLGIANQITELQRWVTQLQGMQQQLQQLQTTYQALSHVTDMGTAVGALGSLGIQNPLPVNAYAVQGMMSAGTNPGGLLSSLNGFLGSTNTTNRVYTAPDPNSFMSQQINANGGGLAGAQALALQLYQSAADRMPLLRELQARISTSKDPAEREALIARIGVEQAYIQNSQTQATNLGNYMQAEAAVRPQQDNEHLAKSINATLQQAQSQGMLPGGVITQ